MDFNSFLLEIFKFITTEVPWLLTSVIVIISVIIIAFLVIVIIKLIKGVLTLSLWGVKLESNKTVSEIQKQFKALNENTNLKTQVLKLINQAIITYSNWSNLTKKEYLDKVTGFYDFFLPGVINIIARNDNMHRIAVFYKVNDKTLKILHGYGYSPRGKEKLELSLEDSKAGYSFTKGQTYHSNDITQDPTYVRNPKSSREYCSLICVPITYNDQIIGVLNVDGLNKDSFDKDDIDYITYMADAISPILSKEIIHINNIYNEEAFEYGVEQVF